MLLQRVMVMREVGRMLGNNNEVERIEVCFGAYQVQNNTREE